jgi:large subunit ribosomal protein L24
MARAAHVRKGDLVVITTGSSKGKKGKVLRVVGNRVIVEKVSMMKRHTKPSQKNPQGGIVDKEGSVHISNVQLFDEKTNKGTRTKITNDAGTKLRVASKSGTPFPTAGM